MRIWDVDPERLCRKHLLGEHAEIHAIWAILTETKSGYRNHPEVERWEGKLRALYRRHAVVVGEMERRGYEHRSLLEKRLVTGEAEQDEYVDTPEEQVEILREKGCTCEV